MITMQTNHGTIVVELDKENAPETCANFEQYVKEGFYDGTIFHRVIDGFMIQGGGMESGMNEKDTRASIKNEATNGLKNDRGTLAMARTPDPHSASSQFFINLKDNDFLNFRNETQDGWGYCVFAKVTDGMDVVDTIKGVATGNAGHHSDVPVEDVILEKVTID
ncbi:MAG: peptidylprolyl isomerase [Gammaproteobacteria bacterium]|nr:peptidylprolyl isomerase [Gammaproteobacteria bacterium]